MSLSDCRLHVGKFWPNGYGQVGNSGLAHRLAWEAANGPIPAGRVLDHLCRNRACVNPDHLEPVSVRENTMRSPIALAAINARKTHCKRGHEFTPENTYQMRTRPGRMCRECHRLNTQQQRARTTEVGA